MRNKVIPYNSRLNVLAKQLRKESTLSEVLLWQRLRGKQMLGYDFHRQKPIDEYIVDFYCPELQLVLEIDGSTHDEYQYNKDTKRQRHLEDLGVRFLRLQDSEVKKDIDGVMLVIEGWVQEHGTHPPRRGLHTLSR